MLISVASYVHISQKFTLKFKRTEKECNLVLTIFEKLIEATERSNESRTWRVFSVTASHTWTWGYLGCKTISRLFTQSAANNAPFINWWVWVSFVLTLRLSNHRAKPAAAMKKFLVELWLLLFFYSLVKTQQTNCISNPLLQLQSKRSHHLGKQLTAMYHSHRK